MNWIVSIFKMANSNWTSRVFTLILIASLSYALTQVFKAKNRSVIINCDDQIKPYQEQVRILSQTLEQVSNAVDALTAKPISLNSMASYSFAVVMDTVVRPMSQQQQLLLIKKKLDSTKIKIDSLNKIIQKQKYKT